MTCRHCGKPVTVPFLDLGAAPPSNAYLAADALRLDERYYPLKVLVCTACWLVQTQDVIDPSDLFSADYAYFSSVSSSWLEHVERFVDAMVSRFGLDAKSHVVEVASNDGYLLQFVQRRGIPCTGIEPTAGTAAVARDRGLTVIEEFFGLRSADRFVEGGQAADLLIANNVLAHVPDINDFTAGVARILRPNGVATFEFPHLLRLVDGNQFDTVYHEHYSYLSLTAIDRVFATSNLAVFDVEELPTHGGSLRVFAQRSDSSAHARSENVSRMLEEERRCGLTTEKYYTGFQHLAEGVKNAFLRFLLDAKSEGARVAAYGAAAKGNTLLNFAGIRSDLISFVADRSPAKQGKFLPGSRIPIVSEARLTEQKPNYIVLFPWNLKTELLDQLSYARKWGAKFVTAIPSLSIS